jgi:hypothetical protein
MTKVWGIAMTRIVPIKHVLMILALSLFSIQVGAYEDDKGKELCRHPKVQEFNLPEYGEPDKKEAPAEAEFSFVISGWSDPKKIKIDAKGMKIPYTVESSETFHRVKGKLPPELTGKFVRLSVRIPAVLGCYTTQGWLLKVADKPVVAPAPATPAGTGADAGGKAPVAVQQTPAAPAGSKQETKPAPEAAPAPSPPELNPEAGNPVD